MTNGIDTTLILAPIGQTALTLSFDPADIVSGATPYLVPAQTLDLGETERVQFVYAQYTEGGEDVGRQLPLVGVPLRVIIKASTVASRIDAYNDLARALINPLGGYLQYKPEGVGAAVLTTYYRYVRSGYPDIVDQRGNRWDSAPTSDGYYTLMVDIVVQTQPIATSDPDNLATLSEIAVTLDNWDTAVLENQVAISATNLKGTLPALVQLEVTPEQNDLGRVILFDRMDGTLGNLCSVYEAEDATEVAPSVAWVEVSDAARGGGAYMKCSPGEGANGFANVLRFTIANPDDHEGRFAVFGVVCDKSYTAEEWTHQVQVRVGSTAQAGAADKCVSVLDAWQLLYMGEFEMPPVVLSSATTDYSEGPYIDWYATRNAGAQDFYLDAILVVYVEEPDGTPTGLDVNCTVDYAGISTNEKLLLDNLPGKRGIAQGLGYVVDSDDDFVRSLQVAPRGTFLELDPVQDHKLTVIQQRVLGAVTKLDDFSDYEVNMWMLANALDDYTEWAGDGTVAADTTNYVEGDGAVKFSLEWDALSSAYVAAFAADFSGDFNDEGRFTDDDYVVLWVHLSGDVDWYTIGLEDVHDSGVYAYYTWNSGAEITAGDHWLYVKKSDFTTAGGFDWTSVTALMMAGSNAAAARDITFDYWRIEKADPDTATVPNPLGDVWDLQPVTGVWAITKDADGDGAVLACTANDTNVEKVALLDVDTPEDFKLRARVCSKDANGIVGVVWHAGDDTLTAGTEDCYAWLLGGGKGNPLEYTNGSYTAKGPGLVDFVTAADTWYTLGVIAKGSTFKLFATASDNLTDDDDVFDADYLLATFTDATLTGGRCGVMRYSGDYERFDDFKLVDLTDAMVPADEVTLAGAALFRTIAPFME